MNFQLDLNSEPIQQAHPDTKPLVVAPDTPIRQVLHQMQQGRKSTALVLRGDKLAGIFDERDALRFMAERGPLDAPISSVMVSQVVTVKESDSVGDAIELMAEHGFRRLPLVDDAGRARGLIKVSGVLHWLVEHFPNLVYTLPPEPHAAPKQAEGA